MFSLKPKKVQQQKQVGNNPTTPKGKDNSNTKSKPQSKKISKSVFEDPFRYRIQLLPQQQNEQVEAHLSQYLTKLRQSLPFKPARQGITKTIKFQSDKNIKQKLSPLVSQQFVIGAKRTKNILYQHHKGETKLNRQPHLTIVFYQQKKHDVLEQLLCLLKVLNNPFIVIRQNVEVNRLLGVRTAACICLMNQEISNKLLRFVGRSAIQVPWLLQTKQILSSIESELKAISNKGLQNEMKQNN